MNKLAHGSSDKPIGTEDASRMNGTGSSENSVVEPSSNQNLPKLNFPAKLHLILSTPEFNDIICWLPHGRAWRVQQQDKLESTILPKFFQHQKAASFYRQVTGWGFHRITSGNDFNAYYHELFLRDAPDLARKMKRPTRTEVLERKQSVQKTPPDFYVMPPATEATTDAPFTSQAMTAEEYQDMLVRRLSTYSLSEKVMFLQLELNKLEKKKSVIRRQLKDTGISITTSTSSPPTASLQQQQATMSSNGMDQQNSSLFDNLQSLLNPSYAFPYNTLNPLDQLRLAILQQQLQQQQQHQTSYFFPPYFAPSSNSVHLALQNVLRGNRGGDDDTSNHTNR